MWNTILAINSVIWVFTSVYFIYSVGASILLFDVHIFLVGLGFFLLSVFLQIIFAALCK